MILSLQQNALNQRAATALASYQDRVEQLLVIDIEPTQGPMEEYPAPVLVEHWFARNQIPMSLQEVFIIAADHNTNHRYSYARAMSQALSAHLERSIPVFFYHNPNAIRSELVLPNTFGDLWQILDTYQLTPDKTEQRVQWQGTDIVAGLREKGLYCSPDMYRSSRIQP